MGAQNMIGNGEQSQPQWVLGAVRQKLPSTLTILPTYKCNAQCEQCCFACSPELSDRLTGEQLAGIIHEAVSSFPGLKVLVFSGGECFLMGQDLFDAIRVATESGLRTRCVTNGFWGKAKASKYASELRKAGLKEINFSTGIDHEKFVSPDAVAKAANACWKEGVRVHISVESDSDERQFVTSLMEIPELKEIMGKDGISWSVSSWMNFRSSDGLSRQPSNAPLWLSRGSAGCSYIFENFVITPHYLAASCCGLTFEHIPEMKIADLNATSLREAFYRQYDDLIKVMINVYGPEELLKMAGVDPTPYSDHICNACFALHQIKNDESRLKALNEQITGIAKPTLAEFNLKYGT